MTMQVILEFVQQIKLLEYVQIKHVQEVFHIRQHVQEMFHQHVQDILIQEIIVM